MSLSTQELQAMSRLVIAAKAVRADPQLSTTESLVELEAALEHLDGARPGACRGCGSAGAADAMRLPAGTWKCLVCGAILGRTEAPRPTAAQTREFAARFNTERRAR